MTKKKNSQLNNLLFNIAIPVVVMMKLSKEEYFGPTYGLIIALAFPLGYGLFEFYKERKVNTISIIGLVSVLLTGGIGLLKLPPEAVAIKEAAIPLVIAIIVLMTNFTKKPLVKLLLLNDEVIDLDKLNESLDEHNSHQQFDAKVKSSSYLLALTLLVSSVLNYVVAKFLVTADPKFEGELYTEQLGQMNLWGNLSIGVVSAIMLAAILLKLFKSVKDMTGHSFEYYTRKN